MFIYELSVGDEIQIKLKNAKNFVVGKVLSNNETKKFIMLELKVDNWVINYTKINDEDYISITNMLKSKDGEFFVSDWLRNRNTIEFLGIWEELHNPNFNYGEFAIIKSQAGLNSYKISVKEWASKTNAIGIVSKAGRYWNLCSQRYCFWVWNVD